MQWKPIDEFAIVEYDDYLVAEKTDDDEFQLPYFAYFVSGNWSCSQNGSRCYPDFYIELPPVPKLKEE